MSELDRRLRLAAGVAGDFSVDPGAPAQETSTAASQQSQPETPATVRIERDLESASPAVEGPDLQPLEYGSRGEQPDPAAASKLPSVEELSQRVSPEVRALLDELFRAQWTEVRRLRPEDLRN